MVHVEVLNQAAEEREGQGEAEFRVEGFRAWLEMALGCRSHYTQCRTMNMVMGTMAQVHQLLQLRWMIMTAKLCGD